MRRCDARREKREVGRTDFKKIKITAGRGRPGSWRVAKEKPRWDMPAGVKKFESSPRKGTSGLPCEGRLGFVVMMVIKDHERSRPLKSLREGVVASIFLKPVAAVG